jgi:hypothetical protein
MATPTTHKPRPFGVKVDYRKDGYFIRTFWLKVPGNSFTKL